MATDQRPTDYGSKEYGVKETGTDLAVRVSSPAGFAHGGRDAERQIEPRIARMEAEMDAARSRGVLGLLRLRYEAWLEDKMKGPAIAKMQARQELLEEQRKTAEAKIRLKATVVSEADAIKCHPGVNRRPL